MNVNIDTRDQASGLRRMASPSPVRVIAVASGKGGVGKTNISVNLAGALSELGNQTFILDADLGLANIDVLLGIQPPFDLQHVINGERTLEEVIVQTAFGVNIIPASSGVGQMADLGPAEHAGLVRAFSELTMPIDFLIVDTAAGISDSVVTFSRAAQEVLVVVCDEPTSITDAYALIKVLSNKHRINRFHVLSNMVENEAKGYDLYRKLALTADKFLGVGLNYLGSVPFDENLRQSVKHQSPVLKEYPRSKSSLALKKIAKQVDNWPKPSMASGNLEFFVERILQADCSSEA